MAEFKTDVVYVSSGDFFYYIEDVPHNPEFAICREGGDDYGYLTVVSKSDLKPREETWQWKEKEKYADELRLLTQKAEENFERVTEKMISAACKALSARIKMNVLFGKSNGADSWAVLIANELEKLIKEDAKDIVKKELK